MENNVNITKVKKNLSKGFCNAIGTKLASEQLKTKDRFWNFFFGENEDIDDEINVTAVVRWRDLKVCFCFVFVLLRIPSQNEKRGDSVMENNNYMCQSLTLRASRTEQNNPLWVHSLKSTFF